MATSSLCPSCGTALKPHAHFCPRCGAPAPPAAATARPTRSPHDGLWTRVSAFVVRQRRPLAAAGAIVVLLGVLATAASMFFRRPEPQPIAVAPEPEVAAAPSTEMASLSELAQEYDLLQLQADDANRRIGTLLETYQRRGGVLPPNFGADLTDDQRGLLADRITQERSGLRNLLQEILDKDKELTSVRARAADLGARLPAHVDAREGDRHDRIAMDFLRRQGISTEQAYQLVSQINLQEMLLPGFRVWTYYENGQFGTWVTRGSAQMTPQEHQQRVLAALTSERDAATAAAAVARAAATAASAETGEFMRIAERERARAEAERAKADADRSLLAALERDRSVIRYAIGARRDLIRTGAITNNMRQVLSFDRAGVLTLDPSQTTDIRIDGSAYGLSRIRQITLLPQVFDSRTDIQATIDGPFAVIRLLNVDKFRQNQFIVVLE